MNGYTREAAIDTLKDMGDEELIDIWNEYCSENSSEDSVSVLNEDFIDEHFAKPSEAVRAATAGEFNWADTYVYFDGYSNLQTFEYTDSDESPIDFAALLDWIERTKDTEEIIELLGLEDEESEMPSNKHNEDAGIIYQPRKIVISNDLSHMDFARNISRIHRWLKLTSDEGGSFTSEYGRYQGYKLFENESFVFVFFKYPQK